MALPCKHEPLAQCWLNAGPVSQTVCAGYTYLLDSDSQLNCWFNGNPLETTIGQYLANSVSTSLPAMKSVIDRPVPTHGSLERVSWLSDRAVQHEGVDMSANVTHTIPANIHQLFSCAIHIIIEVEIYCLLLTAHLFLTSVLCLCVLSVHHAGGQTREIDLMSN